MRLRPAYRASARQKKPSSWLCRWAGLCFWTRSSHYWPSIALHQTRVYRSSELGTEYRVPQRRSTQPRAGSLGVRLIAVLPLEYATVAHSERLQGGRSEGVAGKGERW